MIGDNEYDIDVMRTLTGKSMINVKDEMIVHNNGLMIKSTIGC